MYICTHRHIHTHSLTHSCEQLKNLVNRINWCEKDFHCKTKETKLICRLTDLDTYTHTHTLSLSLSLSACDYPMIEGKRRKEISTCFQVQSRAGAQQLSMFAMPRKSRCTSRCRTTPRMERSRSPTSASNTRTCHERLPKGVPACRWVPASPAAALTKKDRNVFLLLSFSLMRLSPAAETGTIPRKACTFAGCRKTNDSEVWWCPVIFRLLGDAFFTS